MLAYKLNDMQNAWYPLTLGNSAQNFKYFTHRQHPLMKLDVAVVGTKQIIQIK